MFMRFFSSMRHRGLRATPCSKIGFQCYRTKSTKVKQEDSIPQSIDWREKGFSSEVFNQGSCGCCWAAVAVASIESHYKLLTGKVVHLSIQELIDFDTANSGCNGGLSYLALEYAMYNGLASEDDYPYYGCHPDYHNLKGRRKLLMGLGNKLVRKKVLAIDGVGFVTPYCEDQLLRAVARQPVCAGIYAGPDFKKHNRPDLFEFFGPCSPNHEVLIVGYGSDCRGPYWIVRNSWGVEWCVEGHIYFRRNTGDPYGVANINCDPCYPVILEGKEEETMPQNEDVLISENKNAEGIYSLRVLEGAENRNQVIDSLVSARFFGIEGSSHIYGLFSDTVVAYEIVLADGQVVRATKDNEYSDLFYAIPWSQGTLGLLVSAEIKLIPVKEYMRLTYKPVVGNLRELAQAYIDSFAPRDLDQDNPEKVPDFVEGMIYTSTEGVMMTCRYASKGEAKQKGNVINSIGWWFKPWFYQHAQKALKRGEFVEYIPTREYYHRHTMCLYWEGKLILPFGDQWWFRFLLGWLMPPKVSLLKATQGEAIRNYYHENHVIQDMLVPLYKVPDALEWVHREMEVYPLWLCPHRLFKLPVKTMVYPEFGFEHERRQGDTSYAQMYTDIGVYYAPGPVLRGEVFDGAEAVRKLENWLIENHGFQPQYAVIRAE